MILEIELWPQLIAGANRAAVPLMMAQAQYPDKSFARDQRGLGRLRSGCVRGFDLVLAKSERHAERFRHFGAAKVQVMGEMRFEQKIPEAHLNAARTFLQHLDPERPVFCLASTAANEDDLLIPVLRALREESAPKPFFVYVPRHPKDFDATWDKLQTDGFNMLRRSQDFDAQLALKSALPADLDGLFGDSLGEINFYFALAQNVFIGDSFNDEGAHNIIEPLSLSKPVVVGPSIWGIEYPALEALEAGVLCKVETPRQLQTHWAGFNPAQSHGKIDAFLQAHGGATQKALSFIKAHFGS